MMLEKEKDFSTGMNKFFIVSKYTTARNFWLTLIPIKYGFLL